MSPFLTTHRLHLTPLSPLHIGCGEDFEPTNYVIEDSLLYGFDPSRAALNDQQRGKLMDVARRGSLAGVQRFFRDNAAAFKPHAHVVMPVCSGVADMYEQRIGKAANVEASGNQVFVASRTIIWPLVKQMRMGLMPVFHCLQRRLALQG